MVASSTTKHLFFDPLAVYDIMKHCRGHSGVVNRYNSPQPMFASTLTSP